MNERIEKAKITIKTFMNMIEVFMGIGFEVIRYDMLEVKEQKNLYPHSMLLYWGMEFEVFLLKNDEQRYLLHFGKLLC